MSDDARDTKSPVLYVWIIVLWSLLASTAIISTLKTITTAFARPLDGWLVVAVGIFVIYFWLNGMKDVVYTLSYHLYVKRHHDPLPPVRTSTDQPQVVLLYTTCNDFIGSSLRASMRQDYAQCKVVILDDSSDVHWIRLVQAFADEHGIEVRRRSGRAGFKAGNLNNYLREAEYDYFVLLDSDEVIPSNFVTRCLDYFDASPQAGIVQANHRATRNRNTFMHRFARGVDSHWSTYQAVKNRYGFMTLLGHGAMVSRECYRTAGGFPPLVAEDLAFAIEARTKSLLTVFAPDVMCEEEYPVNYFAFKKRHGKWTAGNMEFISTYTRRLLLSNINWYEKLDIILFSYSLPLTFLFSFYILINVVAFPLLGYTLRYPPWMLAPTFIFLLAPMLNDVIVYWKELGLRRMLAYSGHTIMLYGSMFYVSLKVSLCSLVTRKAAFPVTPKGDIAITLRRALAMNREEVSFGIVLLVLSQYVDGSMLPVLLIAVPAIFAMYLGRSAAPSSPQALSGHNSGDSEAPNVILLPETELDRAVLER